MINDEFELAKQKQGGFSIDINNISEGLVKYAVNDICLMSMCMGV